MVQLVKNITPDKNQIDRGIEIHLFLWDMEHVKVIILALIQKMSQF